MMNGAIDMKVAMNLSGENAVVSDVTVSLAINDIFFKAPTLVPES